MYGNLHATPCPAQGAYECMYKYIWNFNLKSCFFIFNMSLIFILSLLKCGLKWASMTCSVPLFHALEKGKAFYVDQSQSEVTQIL